MLRAERLTKVYRMGDQTIRAVDGVDLEIARGEIVAVLGPSGSGKSTLVHLFGALDTPTSGRVLVDGRDLGELSGSERAAYRNENVGFVFQQFYLQAELSALENVELPLAIAGVPRRARREIAARSLQAVGLGNRMRHRPNELSGGQQQRVSIARALASGPRILLADEPTGNLDSGTGHEMMELFGRLHEERDLTVVLVTHDPELAGRAGRVLRMRDGRIVEEERRAPETPPLARPPRAPSERPPRRRLALAAGLFRDVGLGLLRHRTRTALTAVGIGVGGFAIALMVGLGIGLHDFIVTQAEAFNDPLSLWVVNSSFDWDDVLGSRAEQLGRAPRPLEEKSLERLGKLRAGYESFSDSDIEAIREIEGVEDVRPRTYVLIDGVRLVPESEEALRERAPPEDSNRLGPPAAFPETFWVGYSLVRDPGTPFRLEAGRNFEEGDRRAVIVSYQYAEAWDLADPEDLVGREVELLFPALGDYSRWNWVRPDVVEARYASYRARVVGVTRKSVLSSVVFLPPAFGEEVETFQFAGGAEGQAAGIEGALEIAARFVELYRLLDDPELAAALSSGTEKERELWASLERLRAIPESRPSTDSDPGWIAPIALLMELEKIRSLVADPVLSAALAEGSPTERRLGEILSDFLGRLTPGTEEDAPSGRQWGSTVRVRVSSVEEIPRIRAALEKKGYRVRTLDEALETVARIFKVIDLFLSSFGLIALLVAAIGIANTLLMAVFERTQEIGLRKALGATRGQIRRLFALEAAGIGLAGGLLGSLLALGAGAWINRWGVSLFIEEWRGFAFYQAPLWLLGGTVLFSTAVGLAAGVYPAHRAAALDPIAALRTE